MGFIWEGSLRPMDAEQLRENAHKIADFIADYYKSLGTFTVHSQVKIEYCKAIRLPRNLKLPTNAIGCNCKGECVDPKICLCAKLNGGDFPYVRRDGGRLLETKSVVFECGLSCGCNRSCVNRTSQQGLNYCLEVFRTVKKGWALRSWDTIPSGAPVCEYTGILSRTEEIETDLENNYNFDIDCLQTMKGLDG